MKMKFTKPRATLDETLAFANAVREAGGGNPLDALMPAVPSDVSQCLIAKNLNFNCGVGCTVYRGKDRWAMVLPDQKTRNMIAKIGLAKVNIHAYPVDWGQAENQAHPYERESLYGVVLPEEIGQVAADFDSWRDIARSFAQPYFPPGEHGKELLTTFLPYIEESIKETYKNGILNAKGELVL